jgi:hypothetical protein
MTTPTPNRHADIIIRWATLFALGEREAGWWQLESMLIGDADHCNKWHSDRLNSWHNHLEYRIVMMPSHPHWAAYSFWERAKINQKSWQELLLTETNEKTTNIYSPNSKLTPSWDYTNVYAIKSPTNKYSGNQKTCASQN